MNKKRFLLAAKLLEQASYEFSNHGCNDWDFPLDWSEEEKQEFVREMYVKNGNPHEFNSNNLNVPDWWVMSFLADELSDLRKE